MPKISPLMIAPPLIFAGFVALAAVGMFRPDPEGLPSTLIGQQAPVLPERELPGFDLAVAADLTNGEVTLVNFWASWCPPCRAEHPTLLEMEASGLPIIGVNFKVEYVLVTDQWHSEGMGAFHSSASATEIGNQQEGRIARSSILKWRCSKSGAGIHHPQTWTRKPCLPECT